MFVCMCVHLLHMQIPLMYPSHCISMSMQINIVMDNFIMLLHASSLLHDCWGFGLLARPDRNHIMGCLQLISTSHLATHKHKDLSKSPTPFQANSLCQVIVMGAMMLWEGPSQAGPHVHIKAQFY